jgi:hypothetical protein
MITKRTIFLLLTLAMLAAACAPQQQAPSAEQISQQIQTGVALTVAAGEALTAAVQPLESPTPSPLPPPTFTPLPTLTPFATLTPFVVAPGGGGGGSGGGWSGYGIPGVVYSGEPCGDDPRYAGDLINQKPYDDSPETILKTGDPLDVFFTIKNVGSQDWEPHFGWIIVSETVNSDVPLNRTLTTGAYAVPFTVGMANGGNPVKKGEWVTLGGHLTAPASFEGRKPLHITVQFAIVGWGVKFCQPWINIEVIRPGMTP